VELAFLALVGSEDITFLAQAGRLVSSSLPHAGSLCEWALKAPGLFIVEDAKEDARWGEPALLHLCQAWLLAMMKPPVSGSFEGRPVAWQDSVVQTGAQGILRAMWRLSKTFTCGGALLTQSCVAVQVEEPALCAGATLHQFLCRVPLGMCWPTIGWALDGHPIA
jgi:hypothetical protein